MRYLSLVCLPVLAWASSDAWADRELKAVKACSAWGNGCIVAPLRQGRFGLQAKLDSQTWIDCKGNQPVDCRDTIRDDVLDFWETQNEKALILR